MIFGETKGSSETDLPLVFERYFKNILIACGTAVTYVTMYTGKMKAQIHGNSTTEIRLYFDFDLTPCDNSGHSL